MMFAMHRMNARPITAGHRNLPLTTLRPATGYTPEARIYNLAVVRVPVAEPAGAWYNPDP